MDKLSNIINSRDIHYLNSLREKYINSAISALSGDINILEDRAKKLLDDEESKELHSYIIGDFSVILGHLSVALKDLEDVSRRLELVIEKYYKKRRGTNEK